MVSCKVWVALLAALCGIWAGGCATDRGLHGSAAQEVVVTEAPPADRAEGAGVAPGPDYAWVPGHWAWHDRWVWDRGYWMLRPRPGAVWQPGHWDKDARGWVWVPGHW